jgi:CheY-like chemotaxis protein
VTEALTRPPRRVLLADYTYTDILTRLLTGAHLDVTAVDTADSALDEYRRKDVDLVLTRAIFESGRDGFELAREVLAAGAATTRVVIFSPYDAEFLESRLGPPPPGAVLLPKWTVPRLLKTVKRELAAT